MWRDACTLCKQDWLFKCQCSIGKKCLHMQPGDPEVTCLGLASVARLTLEFADRAEEQALMAYGFAS